ncbi:MAG: hypothetical protein JSS95_06965 [Acidobacteria bacterium]|nr:hypothetical protein [Acidobacteriota bacterium]
MPARLNRRRYREIVSALKEIISDKKTPQQRRLRATETLLGVYDRHDRQEERKAQRRATETTDAPTPTNTPSEAHETAEEAAARFLASMKQKGPTPAK